MYGPIDSLAEQHRQDMLQSAAHQRLVKQARASQPGGTFYRLLRKTLADRFNNLSAQLQETSIPAYADHAQIDFDSGVFSAR